MNESILAAIDAELARLQQARSLLSDLPEAVPSAPTAKQGRGRPKGATGKAAAQAAPVRKKRVLSDEARARIAAAQKKRWAAVKKAAPRSPREST